MCGALLRYLRNVARQYPHSSTAHWPRKGQGEPWPRQSNIRGCFFPTPKKSAAEPAYMSFAAHGDRGERAQDLNFLSEGQHSQRMLSISKLSNEERPKNTKTEPERKKNNTHTKNGVQFSQDSPERYGLIRSGCKVSCEVQTPGVFAFQTVSMECAIL